MRIILQWILEKLLEDKDISSKSIVKCGPSVTVDAKSKNSKPGYDTARRYNIRRSKWMLSTNLLLVYHIYDEFLRGKSQICHAFHRTGSNSVLYISGFIWYYWRKLNKQVNWALAYYDHISNRQISNYISFLYPQ
jgi:hypothetical protein